MTQTTLSVDDAASIIAALQARFPRVVGPKKDDICYATQNRQDAVKALAQQADVVLVVGSPNSSNSNRLREVAQNMGVSAYMVDKAADLDPQWLAGKNRVGVTAGASAPEVLVRELVERLRALGATEVRGDGRHPRSGGVSFAKGAYGLIRSFARRSGPNGASSSAQCSALWLCGVVPNRGLGPSLDFAFACAKKKPRTRRGFECRMPERATSRA